MVVVACTQTRGHFVSRMVCLRVLVLILSLHCSLNSASDETKACNNILGLENGDIKNHQLSASSYLEHMYIFAKGTVNMEPKYGRLNGPLAWCGLKAKKTHHKAPFFQVRFGQIMNVSGLATQGLEAMSSYYVKSYTIKFSLDGRLWFNYSSPNKIWTGNSDARTIKKVYFNKLIRTKYLRIYPQSFNTRICLRAEVYGCRAYETGKQIAMSTQHPTTLSTKQLSTISTHEPSTISTQEPSTISTQEPSTISTQQSSTHDKEEDHSMFATPLPTVHETSYEGLVTTFPIKEHLYSSLPTVVLVLPRGSISETADILERKTLVLVLLTSIGFAVLVGVSFIIYLAIRKKQPREICEREFSTFAVDAGVLENESSRKNQESFDAKWV